jgi:predicted MFS family arabinose efflux permease
LSTVFTDQPIRRLYLLNFLVYVALFGYFRMVLVYLVDRWHTGIAQTTFIYSGLALISAIASFFIMAPLTRRFGLSRLAIVACIFAGAAMMTITVPPQIDSIWITAGLTTMTGTIALAACPTILSNAVSEDRQGCVMGNNQALQVGAESLSAMIGGALAAVATPADRFWCVPDHLRRLVVPGKGREVETSVATRDQTSKLTPGGCRPTSRTTSRARRR